MKADNFVMAENFYFEAGSNEPMWMYIYRQKGGVKADPDRNKVNMAVPFEETLPKTVLKDKVLKGYSYTSICIYEK
jgi:hypothetical protein